MLSMGRQKSWLPLLAFAIWANIRTISTLPVDENLTKLLSSSVVTSVSVVTPDSRKIVPAHDPPASPADLLRPDRFQFYTFNQKGEVVTKQMTEKEIQSLIAAGGSHAPMEIFEPIKANPDMGGMNVADVVQNVQNVLKQELNKPTTVMVSVPTIPGHATDEWSNILPSILASDSENSHPSKIESNELKNKNAISEESNIPEDSYDAYKPQHASIVKTEPHVHQSASQTMFGTHYIDKHSRPVKPQHASKPNTDGGVGSSKIPGFHIVMTEVKPGPGKHANVSTVMGQEMKNISTAENFPPQKWKPSTLFEYPTSTKKPAIIASLSGAAEQVNSYTEKPMIPVSVITADAVLTSTQKTKLNKRPIFQMLSTISPFTTSTFTAQAHRNEGQLTTEKMVANTDEKLDTFSIVSETHSTSVKVPGHPEVKIPENEALQTLVPKQNDTEKNDSLWVTVSNLTPTDSSTISKYSMDLEQKITESTTEFRTTTTHVESINRTSTEYYENETNAHEKTKSSAAHEIASTNAATEFSTTGNSLDPSTEIASNTTIMYELMPEVATENEVTESELPMSYTEIPAIKEIIQALNQPEKQNIIYQTERTTLSDLIPERLSITNKSDDSTTEYTTKVEDATSTIMLTTIQQINNAAVNSEDLPTDLADSLSSVISQVAQTVPPIISESENFPLSELKSKNMSVSSNEMYESTSLAATTIYDSTYAEESTTFMESMMASKETITPSASEIILESKNTDEENIFMTKITSETTSKDEKISIKDADAEIMETTSITYSSDQKPGEKPDSSTTEDNEVLYEAESTTSVLPNSEFTTVQPEESTEASIIHINVTGSPSDVVADQRNHTSESPLIRIQLSETASALNQVMKNAPSPTGTPLPTIDLTLPAGPHSVSGSIGSGLIAGFTSSTTEAMLSDHAGSNDEGYNASFISLLHTKDITKKSNRPLNLSDNADIIMSSDTISFDSSTSKIMKFNPTMESLEESSTTVSDQIKDTTIDTLEEINAKKAITTTSTTNTTTTTINDEQVPSTEMLITESSVPSSIVTSNTNKNSTIHSTMTAEPVTISNALELNTTNKPEIPVVRVDVSPETTSTILPPKIQLTDLPIIEISSMSIGAEKTMTNETSFEKPSLYSNDIHNYGNSSNGDYGNVTNASEALNQENLVTMQVPCLTADMESAECQNSSAGKTLNDEEKKDLSSTTEMNKIEASITSETRDEMGINSSNTEDINKILSSEDKNMVSSKRNVTNESIEKVAEKIKEDEKNTSTVEVKDISDGLQAELSSIKEQEATNKVVSITSAVYPMQTTPSKEKIKEDEKNMSTVEIKVTTIDTLQAEPSLTKEDEEKDEVPTTTSTQTTATQTTPSKDDSYMKLGEQKATETSVKNESTTSKPKNSNMKRQPIAPTTSKPVTNKIENIILEEKSSTESPVERQSTQEPSVKITKPTFAESLDNKGKTETMESKDEPSTKIKTSPANKLPYSNGTDDESEEKWTLIPQQIASAYPSKVKPEAKEPPTTTSFPAMSNVKHVADEMHRNGNKPIPLEAIQSAGLDDSVKNLDEDIIYFSNLCNELAFNFWTSANKGLSNSRSLALSPFGMTSMLAMIFLGARGPTSAQMNDVLKLDDVVTFNPHLVFQNITDAVSLARNQGITNAAFVRLLFADRIKVGKLMPFYKEQAQKFYEGFVTEVNFSTISDQVRRRTNLLVRKQTGGRIKDFVKTHTVPLRSPLAALSANVFQTNCNCSASSSEGRDGELYFAVSPAVRQRRLVPVPATVWRSGVLAGYEPSLDATAVALGGSEKLVSTIFVIPGQQGHMALGDTLDRLEQRLMKTAYRETAWDKLLKVIVPRPSLELQLPKFSHRSVVNATAALKRMGLEELFTRHANLKGINGFGHDIHLADLLQMNLFSTCGDESTTNGRHHVEIYPGTPIRNAREMANTTDEYNSELFETSETSNSDTVASMQEELLGGPYNDDGDGDGDESKNPRLVRDWSREAEVLEKPRLKLDRPFLYFVRHNPTGLILHMGRFNPRLLP